jgi:hypothetical protein
MDRVEELENAIESLPPEKFTMGADSASGKLDFLFKLTGC